MRSPPEIREAGEFRISIFSKGLCFAEVIYMRLYLIGHLYICFYGTVKKFRLLDCYTVTCNSPGPDNRRSDKYLFSIKFNLSLCINSCFYSNDNQCSDTERLSNRIN